MCNEKSKSLCLSFNASKCVGMKFMYNLKPLINRRNLTINGKIIKFVDQLKYLGFLLTHNLNNKPDIVNRRNKFYNVLI